MRDGARVAVFSGHQHQLDRPLPVLSFNDAVTELQHVGACVVERVKLPALPVLDDVGERSLPAQGVFFFLLAAN